MSSKIGGTLTYFCQGYNSDNRNVSLPDFNAKILFKRKEEQYSNSVVIQNGITTVEKGQSNTAIRVKNDAEIPFLNHLFNGDGNINNFSQTDYNKLLANAKGKTIKIDNKWAYRAKKEENGIINIELRQILADGTTRSIGESIVIDRTQNLQEKTSAELTISWEDNGAQKEKPVKFEGNFGFSINDKEYKTKNGQILDSNDKPIEKLELPKNVAYQFIGMSNTADSYKDYTYSRKDIEQAKYRNNDEVGLIIGSGAGKILSTHSNGNKYTTEYGYYEEEGMLWWKERVKHARTVSVWLNE